MLNIVNRQEDFVIFLFLIIWYNEKHKTKVSRE